MNSRERVMTAVALAQPDRTPMDFSANTQTQALQIRLALPPQGVAMLEIPLA